MDSKKVLLAVLAATTLGYPMPNPASQPTTTTHTYPSTNNTNNNNNT